MNDNVVEFRADRPRPPGREPVAAPRFGQRDVDDRIQGDLLAHYSSAKVRYFTQIDGFEEPDDCMPEGIMGGGAAELRRSDIPVRVHVAEGAPTDLVVRRLRQIADWIERGPELLDLAGEERKRREARVLEGWADLGPDDISF